MKKTAIFLMIIGFLCASVSLTSCDKKSIRSITRMKKDERKVINHFIKEKGFKIKKASDGQTQFDPDIMYELYNGLYMQVLDKGTDEMAVEKKTHVFIRLEGEMLDPNAPEEMKIRFNNLSSSKYQPIEFIYENYYRQGEIHFETVGSNQGFTLDHLMCEGLAFPMSILGDKARVRLIIPFVIGPDINYNMGRPMYCEEVEYNFR